MIFISLSQGEAIFAISSLPQTEKEKDAIKMLHKSDRYRLEQGSRLVNEKKHGLKLNWQWNEFLSQCLSEARGCVLNG